MEYIGEGALKYNAFSDITIPANVLTIDASAFSGGDGSFKSWLRTVHFEEGSQLENIGDYAFSKCSALQTIALPSGIKNIGVRAFAQCALNDVFIPKSIEIVGKEAFYYNFNGGLQGVVFEDSSQLRKIDEGAFAKNFALATNKFRLPTSALDDFLYWLAAGVGVGSGQTKYAEGASTHILTAKYTAQYRYTLSDNDVKVIDNYISEHSYSDGRPSYIVIPDTLDGQVIKGIKERVPMGLFYANRLAELELPTQLEYIPVNCFKYNALTNVELPEKLFFLGEAAFYGNRLSSLTLPNLTTSGFAGWIIHDHDSNKDSLITKTNGKYVAIDLWSSYTAAYAVKFTDHSGRLLKIDTVKHYAAASPPVAPERVGYTFMGWDKDYTNISQGLTLSAMYERNTSVAIDDKDAKGISIYPNPVSGGRLCLKTDEPISSIVIYDSAGKVVYTSSKSAYSIDVSHLRSGVYVIKINRTFKNLLIL